MSEVHCAEHGLGEDLGVVFCVHFDPVLSSSR